MDTRSSLGSGVGTCWLSWVRVGGALGVMLYTGMALLRIRAGVRCCWEVKRNQRTYPQLCDGMWCVRTTRQTD
eukprot:gene16665-biopygen514